MILRTVAFQTPLSTGLSQPEQWSGLSFLTPNDLLTQGSILHLLHLLQWQVGSLLPVPPDNHDGVITYLEPDNLECEVKWDLECINMKKASGGNAIPAEPFQILR